MPGMSKGMMKNRAAGYLYGGSMAKPKKKKKPMAMGGAKKATAMKHGGMKPGLYMMGKGGSLKQVYKAGGKKPSPGAVKMAKGILKAAGQ
tara:strand:- start:1083 stop:1352 length:270 start_codon:yes stop_codon:yes gene_type:complete